MTDEAAKDSQRAHRSQTPLQPPAESFTGSHLDMLTPQASLEMQQTAVSAEDQPCSGGRAEGVGAALCQSQSLCSERWADLSQLRGE